MENNTEMSDDMVKEISALKSDIDRDKKEIALVQKKFAEQLRNGYGQSIIDNLQAFKELEDIPVNMNKVEVPEKNKNNGFFKRIINLFA
jgi:hypothetical protein